MVQRNLLVRVDKLARISGCGRRKFTRSKCWSWLGIGGATLRPVGDFLKWFESRIGNPRVVLAAWLAICVMVSNMLVPVLAGVSR